ncbi:acetylornithine deacetylase [ANME-1 cluster archaeon GoMg4]|nr:acetylornithine deacetylase [ANME-1 cluster archaeon GoMg4]
MTMGGEKKVEETVEKNETEKYLIGCLTELVRIPTFVPPGEHYGEIVDWLIPVFNDLGFKCERVDMPADIYESRQKTEELSGERANLLATKDYGAKESVDVYTHLDVVPAGEGWSTPPFEPAIKDGRIYGRGVADSKGSVASLLTALSIMNEQELEGKYNIQVALTTDEELGLYSGLCFFADEGLLRGDYLLCMDGDNEGVCVATNGVMNWEMKVLGRSCHSSMPFLGVNAIENAAIVIRELEALKKAVAQRESKVPCSSEMTEITGQKHIKPVFNVTMINGGVKENLIPSSCTLRGDRRYIPEEAIEDVVKEFEAAVETIKARHGIDLELYLKPGFPPLFTDPDPDPDDDDEWVTRVKAAASDAFGVSKETIGVQGGLDIAYAVQRTHQPVCALGVGSWTESNAHGPDENVRISDLKNYVKFLIRLLT